MVKKAATPIKEERPGVNTLVVKQALEVLMGVKNDAPESEANYRELREKRTAHGRKKEGEKMKQPLLQDT